MSIYVSYLLAKKRAKFYFEKIINPISFDLIENTCEMDWRSTKQQNLSDVLIFGAISFDFRYQRPQELATRLANLGHSVFYIEHEFLPTKFFVKQAPISVRKISNNLYKINLSASRNYFIYAERIKPNDLKKIHNSIKKLLTIAKIKQPQIIVQHPFWYDVVGCFLDNQIIYECFDEHSGFRQSGKWVKAIEVNLAKKASAIVVSSQKLLDKFKKLGLKNIKLISNGASTKKLLEIKKPIKPNQIREMQQPIIGYHGAIEEWFNEELIEQILQKYPYYNLVLIGAVNNKKIAKLKSSYKNLHLIGEINYKYVFDYVYYFDIAIIPFSITPLIVNTLPVKFFEYLALKKPIITTALPELIKYKNICTYVESQEKFIEEIPKALVKKHSTKLAKKIRKVCLNEDWQKKAIIYDRFLEKIYKNKV